MTKKQRARRRRTTVLLMLAMALLVGGAVGGTLAWLTDETPELTNTFTIGDINIALTETKSNFKMVPGNTIEKDPEVTVEANSEACWLFVKVDETNLADYIEWSIAADWLVLDATNYPGVYYREVNASTAAAGVTYSVLKDDKVAVKGTVTKDMMGALTSTTYPTLTFTAYAVQRDNIASAMDAWAKITTP